MTSWGKNTGAGAGDSMDTPFLFLFRERGIEAAGNLFSRQPTSLSSFILINREEAKTLHNVFSTRFKAVIRNEEAGSERQQPIVTEPLPFSERAKG
jgi:hypothetical protein